MSNITSLLRVPYLALRSQETLSQVSKKVVSELKKQDQDRVANIVERVLYGNRLTLPVAIVGTFMTGLLLVFKRRTFYLGAALMGTALCGTIALAVIEGQEKK